MVGRQPTAAVWGCIVPVDEPPQGEAEPPSVYCVLHEGVVTFVSSTSTAVGGFAPEHFHGLHVSAVIHPDDVAHVERFLEPGWTGEISAMVRVQESDGQWSWRAAEGVRTRDPQGKHSAAVVLRKVAWPPPGPLDET
jgi:PAS domain S-box-containing protein